MSDKLFKIFGFTDFKPNIEITVLSFYGGVNKGKSVAIVLSEAGQATTSVNLTKNNAKNFARAILQLMED